MQALQVLVLTLACLAGVSAMQFIQDELLWSRATWSDFKLQFPLQLMTADPMKVTLAGVVGSADPEDAPRGYEDHSLSGAVTPTSGTGTSADGSSFLASPIMEVLRSDEALSQAADAVQCMVCQRFVEAAWQGLLQWLLQGPSQEVSRTGLSRYLRDTCHWEVPQEVLRDHVLMEGRIDQPNLADGAAAADGAKAPLVMVQVSARHDEVTKVHELRAVRLACDRILAPEADIIGTAHAEDGTSPPMQLDAVLEALAEAATALEGVATGYKVGADNEIRLVDDIAGPRHNETCRDHHPNCGNWAKWGECERNPQYMQGHDEWPGNCRMSCGACTVPAYLRDKSYNRKQGAALVTAAGGVLRRLEQRLCTDGPPCRLGVASLLKALLNSVKQAEIRSPSPITATAAQQPSMLSRWPASEVKYTRSSAEALTGALGEPVQPSERTTQSADEAAVTRLIHDQCFYLSVDWWTYELCPGYHVRQFHVNEGQSVEQISTLGVFDMVQTLAKKAELGEEQQHLGTADLLPGTEGSSVPHWTQVYSSGSLCQPDPQQHPRVASMRPRSAEVRLACSPDTSVYMVVREPLACSYVVTLYTSAMCHGSRVKPQWLIRASTPQQVQVVLPKEMMAAAQAAAAAFHGQSKQFSVRYTAAVDKTEVEQQAEVAVTATAGRTDPAAGRMTANARSDDREASAATGTALLDGLGVTGLLDGARIAAGSMAAAQDPAASAPAALHSSPEPGISKGKAPVTSGDDTVQPMLQQERIAEARPNPTSDADDSNSREQQTLLNSDADAEGSKRASGQQHPEL